MTSSAEEKRTPSLTVLVLDDDDALRRAAARVLTGRGYHVLTAETAFEARHVAEQWPGRIDLLLCDLVLPDLHGRELANLLQAHRPEMRVLFTSGYSSRGSFRMALERESWTFLAKPFDVNGLVEAVEAALAGPSRGEPPLQGEGG